MHKWMATVRPLALCNGGTGRGVVEFSPIKVNRRQSSASEQQGPNLQTFSGLCRHMLCLTNGQRWLAVQPAFSVLF